MLITMTKLNDLQHGEGTRAFPGCGLQTPWQWEHDVKCMKLSDGRALRGP